jgi:hypothetical protein
VSLVTTVAASPRMTGREQTAPAINYPLLQRFAVKPHDGNTTALVRCEINGRAELGRHCCIEPSPRSDSAKLPAPSTRPSLSVTTDRSKTTARTRNTPPVT